ncbi:MAG: hypothetical protein IJ272_06035 [Clostridia bacterium]|nr:hypothetical protein [Clostridia bacterium]
MAHNNYNRDLSRHKIEKTKTNQHQKRNLTGELLAVDPNHKARGGYRRLMKLMQNNYEEEIEEEIEE